MTTKPGAKTATEQLPLVLGEIYTKLRTIDSLRDSLIFYGAPSENLVTHLRYQVSKGNKCLEIGVSPISYQIGALGAHITCIAPDQLAADMVKGMADNRLGPDHRLSAKAGSDVDVMAAEARGSFDLIVLSQPPSYPSYLASAYQAMMRLKVGGRLIVRGIGVMPIDQLRAFLRMETAWDGCEVIDDETISFIKTSALGSMRWQDQPYVVMNSVAAGSDNISASARRSERHQVRSYSTFVDDLREKKQQQRELQSARLGGRRIRVGLVGYYGFGNYGDELFRSVLEDALPDFDLTMMHDTIDRPYFLSSLAKKVAACDAILIGGGDLVIPKYWTDFYFERPYLEKPVFLQGIGVPLWTGEDQATVGRLRTFFQSPSLRWINVRDKESAQWISQALQPNVPVSQSPDLVFGSPNLPPRTVAADAKVLGLITRKHSKEQSDFKQLAELCVRARGAGYRIVQIIAGNGGVGREDIEHARQYPLPVDEVIAPGTVEGITQAIAECSVVASMKFHGCVMGLALGIPSVSLITTDKFVNLYSELGIKDMVCHFWNPNVASVLDKQLTAVPQTKLAQLRSECRSSLAELATAIRNAV